MLIVMLAATALLADAVPAAAPAPAPAAASAAAPAKSDASDIVCHKEFTVGSNIPTKVCRSKAEDAANRAEIRREVERIQTQRGFRN